MKFIHHFRGGFLASADIGAAGLTVDWKPAPPTRAEFEQMVPEYQQWMRQSLQAYANAVGGAVVYVDLVRGEPEIIEPQ